MRGTENKKKTMAKKKKKNGNKDEALKNNRNFNGTILFRPKRTAQTARCTYLHAYLR